MKLSLYTFITLLVTLMAAPAFAEKPEGEGQRYKVVLEKMKPAAQGEAKAETEKRAKKATPDARDKSEANSKRWWKPWQ